MRFIAALAIAVLACIGPAHAATATDAGKDCHLKRLASFDMVIVHNYIVLPVTINETGVQMVLELAGNSMILDKSAVADLKLRTSALPVQAYYGDAVLDRTAHVRTLAIGGVHYKESDVLVSPTDQTSRAVGLAVAGALGMNAFERVDLELDFINKKVALYSQDHCQGQVVYWASAWGAVPMQHGPLGNVFFPMELDGKKIEASLSTGTEITTLTTDVSKKLYGIDEHAPDVQTQFDEHGKALAQFRAMQLTAGDLKVLHARVRLRPKPGSGCQIAFSPNQDHAAGYEGCIGPIPLHLGMNVLQHLHMYLATGEKTLYFTGQDSVSSVSQSSDPPPTPGPTPPPPEQ